jgi:hypothetical protein
MSDMDKLSSLVGRLEAAVMKLEGQDKPISPSAGSETPSKSVTVRPITHMVVWF